MRIEPYDFRKPSRLAADLDEQLAAWLTRGLEAATERWGRHLAAAVAHFLGGVDSVRPGDSLAELPDAVVAYRVAIGPESVGTLVAFPRPLVLTLVASMYGDDCTELLADRHLTPVEDSLIEYLLG